MRYLIAAAAGSAIFLAYVKTADQFREPDPSLGQIKGWRACIDDGERYVTQCAPGVFLTLAACRAYIAVPDYDNEKASCFDAIDEVRQ